MMWGYGPDSGMMGWGYGYGFGLFHVIVWIVVLVVVIAGAMWLLRPSAGYRSLPRRSRGLDLLEERYARGEINRDEYQLKKRDLGG